ncbi:lipopolysaccharide biosynthesis protein [Embleya sp. NPDC055664]|uniref:lipopolysaccharide biosynthesis protein n=1 Tax=Embleya sp. NPDC059237 TaxID=3346784 RepID=UPI00367588F9
MKTLLLRAIRALPQGTLLVGAGMVVLGGASYVHLAIAGHSLNPDDMSGVSVLWTIIFSIGLGLFFPVEQEITRIVAARAAEGSGTAPVLRRGAVLAGGLLLAVLVLLAAASGPMADRLFDGDRQLLVALGGAFVGLAVVSVTRGVLAGHGAFTAYGTQLALDGGLRIVFAIALGAAGSHSPLLFSLILTVAPILATLATLRPVLRAARPGAVLAWRELYRGLGLLIVSTLLAQLMVNTAVLSVKLLEPEQTALVTALLSALILARVPLFVFGSLQASLLPGLSRTFTDGDRGAFRGLITRACLVVSALGVAGGLGATVLGPWIIRVFFNAPKDVLGPLDFAWFSAGTLCYMLAMVLGQGVMAMNRHRAQLVAWIGGTAVLVAITCLPGDIRVRVEIAFAAATAATALLMALMLRSGARRFPAPARTASPVRAVANPVGGAPRGE